MKLILGTVQFGLNYGINNPTGKIPKEDVFEILDYAHKHSINTLDTAHSYGESEQVIGEFMHKKKANFNIISKFSPDVGGVELCFQDSLRRLNSNKMYCYLVHDVKSLIKDPALWLKMIDLKKRGLVEKIGFSVSNPEDLECVMKNNVKFDIIQLPYSVFDQRFTDFFPYLKENEVEIHARSVFLQGLFFKNPSELTGKLVKIKDKLLLLRQISKQHNLSISAVCINFAALNENISKIIIGVNSLNDLKENIEALKNIDQVKNIHDELLTLREDDANIVFPVNWKETA
ncbi:MAG: aldo/keto reductase [Nanoarchaeota archaeon]|nr:aldo/keto reductase [Nanoarchaeota archaeon]MBU1321072.1 aldo/keto reductase [Nanoarchaeota archaeon]MBU1597077.1 aldo/keto reductase [Nanoarchaeota archaeon]MBU2440867.1 aldo/keto reductase [Nanoarchaeota archaeon]